MERITISYAGVHQAYQLALAAQEIGELKAFYCALYDDPEKWGASLGGFIGPGAFEGRRAEGLALDRIVEFPWPLVCKSLRDRFYRRGRDAWLSVNERFDRWAARRIENAPPQIFVGTASCDLHSLKAAKRYGATLLHDCPGLHDGALARLMAEAADLAGIKAKRRLHFLRRRNGMQSRKAEEYSLADKLLVYSEFHRKSFEEAGFSPERLFIAPLWADRRLWYRTRSKPEDHAGQRAPLKLLFVGSINLRKGMPFLIAAMRICGKAAELTIVGPRSAQLDMLLNPIPTNVRYLPPQPKPVLRKTYEAHDVLVLPSIADSFGFVALEAMACGLPVIVTQNCGCAVPEPDWRVPAMDSAGLAARILHYADDRVRVFADGKRAAGFAAQFSAERYRRTIGALFAESLAGRTAGGATPKESFPR